MRVHLLRGADEEGALRPADGFDWAGLGGVPYTGRWPEPGLAPYDGVAWRGLDCTVLSAATDGVVVSERAEAALHEAMAGSGEVWPVRVAGKRNFWVNILGETDALGVGTEGDFVEGFLLTIRRLAFRSLAVSDAPGIFRVPELPSGYLFARDRVVDAAAGLSGFRFDLVWSADGGGVWDAPGLGRLVRRWLS